MSILKVESLSKSFGGVHAVEDLSFEVQPGHIHSLIGPNGAGKTTAFNMISGIYVPTAGRVVFDGQPIAGVRPSQLAERGMSRTFQNLQIFFNMKAVENVMVGAHLHLVRDVVSSFLRLPRLRRSERETHDRAVELMRFVGLDAYIASDAGSMPYGALKRLEIARALASRPKLLLLDEPAAGLNHSESAEISEVIRKVVGMGVTVILVEHDMKMVMGLSDHIVALDHGRKLAEGTPEEVRANPDVIRAYLGEQAA